MLAREGYVTIFVVVVFAVGVSLAASYIDHWIAYLVYGAMVLLVGLLLNFFRDPDRDIPDDEDLVLAPADGKVVLIKEVEEKSYIKGRAIQISIFLSVVDVHVNRNPISGILEYLKYHPGVNLMAWDHQASELNERADFGVRHSSGAKVFYRQITGFLARRIVYHVTEGEQLKSGERFGMMKFGSRMDILLPPEAELFVEQGEQTVAGETALGRLVGHSPETEDAERAEISNNYN